MDFATAVATLNDLLIRKQPAIFDSAWIRTNAPSCYRFIQENVRREYGGIDWDQLTSALERRFQKLWKPRRIAKQLNAYEGRDEVQTILNKYRDKMYVFIAASDKSEKRI